jgi:AcrR family transcriptional regulator
MPRLIETESRTEGMVAAINFLLAGGGPTALSLRSIALESGISGSSLLHHYGSRERMIHLAAMRTGRARLKTMWSRIDEDGPLAFLPRDLDEVVDARVWLAWLEMWRSEDALRTAIHGIRSDERAQLAVSVDHCLVRSELDALVALIDGLMVAVCAPIRPLPLATAREILRAQTGEALRRHAT